MEEQETSGISIGEIFRVIFSRKWLALIVAAAIMVAGTIAIVFGYNSSKEEYVTTFSLNFAGSDTGLYPDMTRFDYRSIVSSQSLNSVKAGNEEQFGNINTDRMYKDGKINISQNVQQISSGSSGTVVERTYTLRVQKNFFKNKDQARAFIEELTRVPVNYISNWAQRQNFNTILAEYENSENFDDMLDCLSAQVSVIRSQFEYLRNNENTSLDDAEALIKLSAFEEKLAAAKGELHTEGYVKDDAGHTMLKTYGAGKLNGLVSQYKSAYGVLTSLRETIVNADALPQVVSLAQEVENYARKIDNIIDVLKANKATVQANGTEVPSDNTRYTATYTVTFESVSVKSVPEDFELKVAGLRSDMTELAAECSQVYKDFYTSTTFVEFEDVVEAQGGMGLIMAVALSLIAGLIIGCIVALIVAMPGYLRRRNAAQTAREQTVEQTAETPEAAVEDKAE